MTGRPKVLIFFGNTGGGHLRVAQSIAQGIQERSPDCELVLCDGFGRARFGRRIDPIQVFSGLTIRWLWLFNLLYRLADTRAGVKVLRLLIRWAWGAGLAEAVEREAPDLVVSTHSFFSPATLGNVCRRPTWVTVVTDLGSPPLIWFDPTSDHVVTPGHDVAARANGPGGVKMDRIHTFDRAYPLSSRYQKSVESPTRRECILVLGGGAGSGAIAAQVALLRRHFPGTRLVVVCGRNARLRAELTRKTDPLLTVHGFVDTVDELMRDSDVVISKAGPGAIAEAAVLGKPLVISGWVGLQERDNVDLVVQHALGIACLDVARLPAAVAQVYQDYERYCQGDQVFRSSSSAIAELLLSLVHVEEPRWTAVLADGFGSGAEQGGRGGEPVARP